MNILIRSPQAAGAAVRSLRKEAKLTQMDLAEKLGVRQATISSLENGDTGVRIGLFFDALSVLGTQLRMTERERDIPPLEKLF